MSRKNMYESVPDPEILIALEPEELAGILLQFLNSLGGYETHYISRSNLVQASGLREYPPKYQTEIMLAYTEAWMWLENEGFIVPDPGQTQGEFRILSRRARQLKTVSDFKDYRKGTLLPKELLHAIIIQKVWPMFVRGEYDTAVFQSFKEVEVAVRNAGGYDATVYGVDLMRVAFHADKGPLTDMSAPKSEREALAHLFAGAIGSYKNPHSHRSVLITGEEAAEMIILANHLLKIVAARTGTP